ncbi:hypothetical protein EGW08_017261 [Elysia chlorotica]|uniref:Uncharacterized protein n=1 Tax=Elysia chlorotica TaxID=188477 RepID=A0A3S0ZD31_ELYCH|nr:hypothetical protein EGW08_017261 [Elysia chlorotica]
MEPIEELRISETPEVLSDSSEGEASSQSGQYWMSVSAELSPDQFHSVSSTPGTERDAVYENVYFDTDTSPTLCGASEYVGIAHTFGLSGDNSRHGYVTSHPRSPERDAGVSTSHTDHCSAPLDSGHQELSNSPDVITTTNPEENPKTLRCPQPNFVVHCTEKEPTKRTREKILSASSGFQSLENVSHDPQAQRCPPTRVESVSSPLFSPIYFQPVAFKNLAAEYPVPRQLDRKASDYLKLMAHNANRRSLPDTTVASGHVMSDHTHLHLQDLTSQSEESLLDLDPRESPSHRSSDTGEEVAGVPFEQLDRLTQMAAGARPKTRVKDGRKKRRKKKSSARPALLEIPTLVTRSGQASGQTLGPPSAARSWDFSSSGDVLSPSSEDPFDDNFRLDTTGDDTDVFLDDTDDLCSSGEDGSVWLVIPERLEYRLTALVIPGSLEYRLTALVIPERLEYRLTALMTQESTPGRGCPPTRPGPVKDQGLRGHMDMYA